MKTVLVGLHSKPKMHSKPSVLWWDREILPCNMNTSARQVQNIHKCPDFFFFCHIYCCMIWWGIFQILGFYTTLLHVFTRREVWACSRSAYMVLDAEVFSSECPSKQGRGKKTFIALCHLHSWQLNLVTSSLQALNECSWSLDYVMKGTGWYDAISWAHRLWWTAGALWDFSKELNQRHENDRSSLNEKGSELRQLIFF